MLLGAISKRFDTIGEFTAFENFIGFEKEGKNKVKRVTYAIIRECLQFVALHCLNTVINLIKMFRGKT